MGKLLSFLAAGSAIDLVAPRYQFYLVGHVLAGEGFDSRVPRFGAHRSEAMAHKALAVMTQPT